MESKFFSLREDSISEGDFYAVIEVVQFLKDGRKSNWYIQSLYSLF